MRNKSVRPASVWAAQFLLTLCVICVILLPIVIVRSVDFDLSYVIGPILFRYFVIVSPFILLNVAAIYAMAMRWRFGRWLAVFALLLLSLIFLSHAAEGSPLIESFMGGEPTWIAASLQVALSLLCLILVVPLIFAAKVKTFFRRDVAPEADNPPPPPSFDS